MWLINKLFYWFILLILQCIVYYNIKLFYFNIKKINYLLNNLFFLYFYIRNIKQLSILLIKQNNILLYRAYNINMLIKFTDVIHNINKQIKLNYKWLLYYYVYIMLNHLRLKIMNTLNIYLNKKIIYLPFYKKRNKIILNDAKLISDYLKIQMQYDKTIYYALKKIMYIHIKQKKKYMRKKKRLLYKLSFFKLWVRYKLKKNFYILFKPFIKNSLFRYNKKINNYGFKMNTQIKYSNVSKLNNINKLKIIHKKILSLTIKKKKKKNMYNINNIKKNLYKKPILYKNKLLNNNLYKKPILYKQKVLKQKKKAFTQNKKQNKKLNKNYITKLTKHKKILNKNKKKKYNYLKFYNINCINRHIKSNIVKKNILLEYYKKKEISNSFFIWKKFFDLLSYKYFPIAGIRIECNGPTKKGQRTKMITYTELVKDYRLSGKMPNGVSYVNVYYWQTYARKKRAAIGIKLWLLLYSPLYSNMKKKLDLKIIY
jgi:hypothetical protein